MPAGNGSTARVMFHADDFGMNAAVNQGIITAFRCGVLTSTSLLANANHVDQACQSWPALIVDQIRDDLPSMEKRRKLKDPKLTFDLGIHLNLTQGCPLTAGRYPEELLDRNGCFPGITNLFFRMKRANRAQLTSVAAELEAQVQRMDDHGLKPTHLNGHQ